MEMLLIDFINTLDVSLKRTQKDIGDSSGFAGLTLSQLQYIDAIHQLGEPTVTEIADRLDVAKASVSAGVKKLISKGYVRKTQSEVDRRVFYVSLTDAGELLVQAKYRALHAYGMFIRSALSDEEVGQFEAILNKLVKQFEQDKLHQMISSKLSSG